MLLALPEGVVALGAGTVLALGAAAVVLGPLWRDADDEPAAAPRPDGAPARGGHSSAVDALREIEFDRATGKLSDDDYRELKATYTREALAELRAKDAAALGASAPAAVDTAAVDDDAVERAIRRFRSPVGAAICPVDGVRAEPDALFCSSCGRYLAGRCPRCGAACDEEEQRFCASCGDPLGAAA